MSSNLGLHILRRRLCAVAAQRPSLLSARSLGGWRTTAAATRPGPQWRRDYHRTAVFLDEEQLSDKDKKKALKAKAKAAMAAATEKEEDAAAAADKKAALEEELAAKKAAEGASAETVQVEASPSAEKAAEATPEAAPEAAPASEAAPEAAPAAPVERKPVEYSTPELAADAAKHKEGLDDPTRPHYQNPLHHNNPDSSKIFREDFESQEAFENASLPAPPLDLGDGIAAPEYLHALADEVVSLSMLEMNELVNKIADHYGFHEGMLSPDDDGAEGADDDDEAEVGGAAEEQVKTVFDIKLVAFDAKAKIKVIKEVRALAGLGLKEAKELVESAPKVVHKDVKKEEADEIKAKLEELGATVEIV